MRRLAILSVVAASVLSACSVSTPRGEEVAVSDASTDATQLDGTALAAAPVTDDAGASVDTGAAGTVASASPTASGRSGSSASGSPSPTAGAASAPARPASGASSTQGITKDTVTVSIIAGFSGPLAAMVGRAYDGLLTWQDDVNAAGGIHGRKVVFKRVDHKETADGGVAACKEALSNGSWFAMVPEGVDATVSAVSCLDAAGMPTFYYSATTDKRWKVAFADIITSEQAGASMASYVAGPLRSKAKKVGVIHVNQASYEALAKGFVPEAKRIGMTVAGVEAVEANAASFTGPLLRLRNAGVEVLVISATTDAIGIIRDIRSMGWSPRLVGWGFQFDFVTVAGRDLFNGVEALRAYATVDSAAYAKYEARMAARGRGRGRTDDLEGFSAYGHALVMGELIKRAGPTPTRATLIAGAETFSAFDNGIVGPLTWTATDHVGSHTTFPTVCCNSDYTWKRAGEPKVSY